MRRTGALLLALALAGCGFHLRGDTPMGLKTIFVSSAVPSQVLVELRRQLAGNPTTKLVTDVKQAEAQVKILSESAEKTIQTLTGEGRVFDFQMRLKVGYQVTDPAERIIVEPAEIELRRVITYSTTAPLAKEAEEKELYAEMRQEAAARILRRLAVVRGYVPQ